MAITMQGNWTLRVRARNASVAQRFIISGADAGNGTYEGSLGNGVFVKGAQWSVDVEHLSVAQVWRVSAQRIGLPGVMGGLLSFEIASGSGGSEEGYDDLVLACSLPASRSDHVVYGAVKTYAGACFFNPGRNDYIVIDSPFDLDAICACYPQMRHVIGKLYPDRRSVAPVSSMPMRDFKPIVIPTGVPNVAVGLAFHSQRSSAPEPDLAAVEAENLPAIATRLDQAEAEALSALQTTIKRVPFKPVPFKAGVGRLARGELEAIAKIRDAAIRFHCDLAPAPSLQLRFQQYDRTTAERRGGGYTGTGERETLGLAVTDELGNYIFRFRVCEQSEGDDIEEDDALATAQRPDLIVQVLDTGLNMTFETAPYDHIANLRRIDLCVPHVQDRCAPAPRVIEGIDWRRRGLSAEVVSDDECGADSSLPMALRSNEHHDAKHRGALLSLLYRGAERVSRSLERAASP